METIPEDLKDFETKDLVEYSEDLGKKFSGGKSEVKTSQLRNVFSDIKRIQLEWENNRDISNLQMRLQLLKPRLAYAAGKPSQKPKRKAINLLKTEVEKAIDGVLNSTDKEKAAENFFKFIESVVAYHKYYGGD